MPFYNQIANIPRSFIPPTSWTHGPGERRTASIQTIDIMPALLDMFGVATNATDGRYTCFRYTGGPRDAGVARVHTLAPEKNFARDMIPALE